MPYIDPDDVFDEANDPKVEAIARRLSEIRKLTEQLPRHIQYTVAAFFEYAAQDILSWGNKKTQRKNPDTP